ncbi:prolyl oligopeptidase family serine peptidase [uncultured Flavobacterium sp.]|uniref:prolyl oligopeptidase family serine peptidase n=1 Tax=uncultured Flavobacterium sp. TaxID=165435 RepID=UPI0012106290|nr:prolyl oligopeptidase family serine peptidase [uncultured Flavobacterium sp.]THD32776.1 MAG: S9 family peptidase [Flavobacterium johnsoniae]
MKKHFLLCSLLLSFQLFAQNYPEAKKVPVLFSKHQFSYQDDYSWMEKTDSKETKTWVNLENELTDSHLEAIKKNYSSLSKIKEYDFLSTYSIPSKKGKYFFASYRIDKDKPAYLFYKKNLNDDPIELINPSKIFNNNNVSINGYYPSKSSKLLAFSVSNDGSDMREVRFVNLDNRKNLDDKLTNVRYSNLAWNKDEGVFYKRNRNTDRFAVDTTYQLYYHKIGALQENDKLVYDTSDTKSYFTFFTAEDKLFVIEQNEDETQVKYFYATLSDESLTFTRIFENTDDSFDFLNYVNGRVYFSTSKFGWGEVRSFDLNGNDEKVIVPQIYANLLVGTFFYKDYIITKYKTVGSNYMSIYDYEGKFIRKFEAPMGMDFRINYLEAETKNLYVTFFSYTISNHNYKLNIETGKHNPYFNDFNQPKPSLFPFDYFETKAITYKSRDNKDVPITIIYKKGTKLDGKNPTLLEAYGGFGAVSGPHYDTGLLYFLEKGGVYAYAEIRGGGEKGIKWHTEGKGLKKINTFNDFIDAAEYLIKENYTNPSKLAITGGSQGGLLVGVAMTKRPDLFKVAIPKVGAFDMAKFDLYTVGKRHLDEYGNPNIEAEFNSLLSYSPYHNIKEDVNYPTTLIITSENDDRVPPLHSYKFAARLQNRSAQKNPIYLKTLSNSGHSGKSTYQGQIEEEASFYNFLLYHLNN